MRIDDLGAELGGLRGRTVLVRSDLNAPMAGGVITDDGRIRASLPTITKLAARGARVVVMAHLGRPEGVRNGAYSLRPAAHRMSELLGTEVAFATDTVGESARSTVAGLADGEIALLENVRFEPAETAQADQVRAARAEQLATLADAFVSDGFGVVHRKQASVYDIARCLPSAMGDLVAAEITVLERLTEEPAGPYVVALGGSKVSDKLGVIDNLLEKADKLLIGGGMAYTFLAARGFEVGTSLLEPDQVDTCRRYLERARQSGVELLLPSDAVVADRFAADAQARVVAADSIPSDAMGLDIGPETARTFAAALADARTVFWNGPMGVFEFDAFAEGTRAVAQALTKVDGLAVVGGGDSAAAIRRLGCDESAYGHISTGGGASLEYLEGKTLPGVEVLRCVAP
ncbi:phosphoglycerate kinase [Rhodococcus opacus]|uniref:phosphoglycerate kinase n=1 Tax=Rhodococcus opacus TaxID=37919 RepID=UPI0007CD71AB|nr:phosphoglycerate kinase [Rhodococcus opacus]MDX5962552.1 phosphoglycerate kinase [Rhodococcus opacus]CAG7641001.1 Phosphoglycerate kinase [Rhodococcus opacus]